MIPLAVLSNWILSDPNHRLAAPPIDLGDGLIELQLLGGWTGTDPASAPVLYQAIAGDDGVAVGSSWDGTDVLQIADETPIPATSGVAVAAGWMSAPPTDLTGSHKFGAMRALASTRDVVYLRGTNGSQLVTSWAHDAPSDRLIRLKYPSRQGLTFVAGDARDGALARPKAGSGLVDGSYYVNTTAFPAAKYRAVLLGRTTVDATTRTIRLRVRAGLDRESNLLTGPGAQLAGDPLNVAFIFDSLGCGMSTPIPWLLRVIEALLTRSGWQWQQRPIRFCGWNLHNGEAIHFLFGRSSTDIVTGQYALETAPDAATWAAAIAANVQLDRVYIELAANDHGFGRTDDQIIDDRATIANAFFASHPRAEFIGVAPRALPGGSLDSIRARINAGEVWADRTIPMNGYPAGAFASDGIHPSLPPGDLDLPGTWDTFNFQTCGIAWLGYHIAADIAGEPPPLRPGEVAPV